MALSKYLEQYSEPRFGFHHQGALASTNPILRCAAGEALGRMSQVVGESKFVAEMAQYSFDKYARTPHSHTHITPLTLTHVHPDLSEVHSALGNTTDDWPGHLPTY